MLQTLLKLYVMSMAHDVRSPMPHLVGPPGCGKSSVAYELAHMVGKKLHVVNVSRLSPLEVEGVQMPTTDQEDMRLRLLHSTIWTQLQEGDIVLFDEFLRGFPEVYNALLDILTSREVGGLVLPQVFILGASNSVTTYDSALEDRLMHILVPDPRRHQAVRNELKQRLIDELQLHEDCFNSPQMDTLLSDVVLPGYNLLDSFTNKAGSKVTSQQEESTRSLRNLIGQAKLRHIETQELKDLLAYNNERARVRDKMQYFIVFDHPAVRGMNPDQLREEFEELLENPKLPDKFRLNLTLNIQMLLALQEAKETPNQKEEVDDLFA